MEMKNVDKDTALGMFDRVTAMASEVGLNFNIEKAITANSLNAHRLLHFAKKESLGDAVKEALLKAHLEDAKNMDDLDVLLQIAKEVGLDEDKVKTMLLSDALTYEVRQDELEARNIGVSGVPFFVLDNKYAVSGAQPVSVFTEALQNAWENHKQEKLTIIDTGGENACDLDGNCD